MNSTAELFPIVLIAIGLAMDAFAVSITSGVTIQNLRLRHALRIAFAFGLFQAMMPIIGWYAGLKLSAFVQSYDHWIAFGLLTFIGAKMIYEAYFIEEEEKKQNPLKLTVLLGLAIATSLDAMAVGLTYAFLKVKILMPALVIGLITFLISFLGVQLGNKIGEKFGSKMEIVGGLILIGIGIRILLQHLLL